MCTTAVAKSFFSILRWTQFSGLSKLRWNRDLFGHWVKIISVQYRSRSHINCFIALFHCPIFPLLPSPHTTSGSEQLYFRGLSSSLLSVLAHVELMALLCKSAISYINKTEFNYTASSNSGSQRERLSYTHSCSQTNSESPINLKCMFWTVGRNLSTQSKRIRGEHANSTEETPDTPSPDSNRDYTHCQAWSNHCTTTSW